MQALQECAAVGVGGVGPSGITFRGSTQKSSPLLQYLPTNLHVQEMRVRELPAVFGISDSDDAPPSLGVVAVEHMLRQWVPLTKMAPVGRGWSGSMSAGVSVRRAVTAAGQAVGVGATASGLNGSVSASEGAGSSGTGTGTGSGGGDVGDGEADVVVAYGEGLRLEMRRRSVVELVPAAARDPHFDTDPFGGNGTGRNTASWALTDCLSAAVGLTVKANVERGVQEMGFRPDMMNHLTAAEVLWARLDERMLGSSRSSRHSCSRPRWTDRARHGPRIDVYLGVVCRFRCWLCSIFTTPSPWVRLRLTV